MSGKINNVKDITINKFTEEKYILKYIKKMRNKIIKYGAEWCQPCKVQSKIFDNLKNQYMDVEFTEIDIDKLNQDTIIDLNIKSIPTLIFKVNDEIKFKHVGVLNEKDLINKINTIFN